MANQSPSPSDSDVESQKSSTEQHISHFTMVRDQACITPQVLHYQYAGSGTNEDPYLVEFLHADPRNPMNWSDTKKWTICAIVAIATLAVAFLSSAYSGGMKQIMAAFDIGSEVATLGISLFVLGFAIGPLLWAPMSELYGRQILFTGTYVALTAFNAGAIGANSASTLITLRFFAGAFGSSPLTNAGGVIADMFPASQRGLAMSLFSAAPFMGPVLGPIVGGFVGEDAGWRWVMGIMAIFTGVVCIVGTAFVPETFAPVILRRRAEGLSKRTGKVYVSRIDVERGQQSLMEKMKISLSRPWILLFREPIVLLLSIYMAIIYGTLYMLFAAFPIVFQEHRGWSQGVSGLAFCGIAVGMIFALIYNVPANKRYARICKNYPFGIAPPEKRLPPTMIGSIAIPVGMFWFAWTNSPSVHWIVPIIATVPFGFGVVLVFLSIMNYLIDAYTVYAASVLAANSVLRSCFGAAFPLFTSYMYDDLGLHWASSVPAFLALACVPFPFFFYKYGETIRLKCKYAAQAAEMLKKMLQHMEEPAEKPEPNKTELRTLAADDDLAKLKTREDENNDSETRSVEEGTLREEKMGDSNQQ